MKKNLPAVRHILGWLILLVAIVTTPILRAAGPFTVTVTTDTHATTPASSPNDSGGHISLRSAIEAANAQAGATIINIPASTYNLTLGELDIGANGFKTNTLLGAGAATTIINQTDPTNRVFNIDFNSFGRTVVGFSGLTIQGGHDGADNLGGAGILAGSVIATPKDVLTLSNCVVQNNHCTNVTTQEPGGGIQMAGGDLNLNNCVFSNNSSGQSFGGAIFSVSQSVVSLLNVTNSIFVNNSLTNNSGAGPDGGGAIMAETLTNSVYNIVGCTFTNNRVIGNSGSTYGGALQINGGTLNLTASTFVTNSATGAGGLGGAIYADAGTNYISFCRFFGNTASVGGSALYNHGSNGANTVATNNWWGCDGGPGAAGCDVASGDGSTLNFTPWLIITNTASPNPMNIGQSTTLTASVLKNSSNQTLTAAQVATLIGLPLTWTPGAHGGINSAQATIQANGLATAIYTNDNTCNNGAPGVTLDNGTSITSVTVQCADLTIFKTNNVNGAITLGGTWTWTIHVANTGLAPAPFANGNSIVLDNMPSANMNYGSPAIANVSGVSGTLVPGVDASKNLTVTASGAVTLNAGGSFDVQVTATPTLPATYGNPRSGGVCVVDPNNVISESNEGSNSATNGVTVNYSCPTITATTSGSTGICLGNSAVVSVAIAGGTPPYTVTLNNGGGTQMGGSPLLFTVSPATTTIYQFSSGTDSLGCPIIDSGGSASSATISVNTPTNPIITLSPASVFANSAGNQAIGSPGFASYAWTINNGNIVGPTNQPTVNYVAGASNNVVLNLTAFNVSGCSGSALATASVITGFSVHTNVAFTDALPTTTMTMAFDGTNYWSCSGGNTTGTRLARYSLNGTLIATYSPGLDLRSLTTKADGTLLAHDDLSAIIYKQTTPGVFVSSGVSITGGSYNSQCSVILNGAGTEFDAMSSGVVSRWNTNGAYLGAVNLIGYGNLAGESTYPQNRGLAVLGNLWLTYNGTNILSLWDTNGNRITQLTLPGAGTNFDSSFSFSFCNGKVFIVDVAGGKWRGFDLFSSASVAVLGAESTTTWISDVTNKVAGVGSLPKVDFISALGATPTLAQLRGYQSVMVFSDNGFSDSTGIGNVLADYLDQGGGVVLQTFVFATNSFGILGRINTGGYIPLNFATGTAAYPSSLTLVKDLATHPLLDGVNSFNGGTTSYQNAPVTLAAGATLVGHWSNGQPLIGTKDSAAGRSTALNFFPPSSDAFSVSWVSSTDGAKLMANALLWSGKIPPTLLAGPADQILPLGATASFKVVAAGTSPLGYQWRLNGTNLPGATAATLNFTVQNNSSGAYSVVVTNLYGATISLNAALNPQLRFLSPVVAGGTFSLFLADADGSPVATNRAARVSLYGATNLAQPFSLWNLLTNPVVPNGTQLRADGFTTTNSTSRFFRAVEAP